MRAAPRSSVYRPLVIPVAPSLPDPGSGPSPSRARVLVAALTLFFVALALRWTGIGSGMPHIGEPDPYIVQQMDALRERGLADRHMAGWKYPHLVATIAAALPLELDTLPQGAPLEAHLAEASKKRVHVRRVTAFLSSVAAPATFLVALRLLGFRWALLAGLIAATSLLQLCYSWQARPHGPVAGMAAMATWLCVRFGERPSLPRAGAMGFGCALSLSTLHTGAAALGPMGVALLLALGSMKGRRWHVLGMAAAAGLIVTSIGTWFYLRASDGFGVQAAKDAFALDGSGEADAKVLGNFWMSGHPLPNVAFTGEGLRVFGRTMTMLDPILGVLALIGLVTSLKGLLRPRQLSPAAWCLLAFTVPTFTVLCGYTLSYSRFFLLVILPLAVAGAAGCRSIARLLPKGHVGALGAGLACALMFFVAGKFAWLRTQPDSFTVAAETLEREGLAKGVVHRTNIGSFPRFVDPAFLPESTRWTGHPWERYQLDLKARTGGVRMKILTLQGMAKILQSPDPAGAAASELSDADAAIVALSPRRGRPLIAKRWDDLRDTWLRALDRPGWEAVETISTTTGEPGFATGYWVSFPAVLRAQRLGPTISVYRRVAR